jgi:hypothetical protein
MIHSNRLSESIVKLAFCCSRALSSFTEEQSQNKMLSSQFKYRAVRQLSDGLSFESVFDYHLPVFSTVPFMCMICVPFVTYLLKLASPHAL